MFIAASAVHCLLAVVEAVVVQSMVLSLFLLALSINIFTVCGCCWTLVLRSNSVVELFVDDSHCYIWLSVVFVDS